MHRPEQRRTESASLEVRGGHRADRFCPTPQPVCACDDATLRFDAIAASLATPTEAGSADGAGNYWWALFELGGASVDEVLCADQAPDLTVALGGGDLMADTVVALDFAGRDGMGFYAWALVGGEWIGRAAAEIGEATNTEIQIEATAEAP